MSSSKHGNPSEEATPLGSSAKTDAEGTNSSVTDQEGLSSENSALQSNDTIAPSSGSGDVSSAPAHDDFAAPDTFFDDVQHVAANGKSADTQQAHSDDASGAAPPSLSGDTAVEAASSHLPAEKTASDAALPDADDEEDQDEEEDDEEEDTEDHPMTLGDHLRELRKRVFRSFLCLLFGFAVCYPFAEVMFAHLVKPLLAAMPENGHLIYTAPQEAFFTYLKLAFMGGMFVASPLIFYQVWAFVAPGLYKEEKTYMLPLAFFSALFFIAGGAFCYFISFSFIFDFFMSYNTKDVVAMPSLKEYLSFSTQLIIAFGVVFELPLFIFFLSRLGIVTAAWLRKMRRYAILVNVIVAAILTPPDVISQMLMAGPLLVLYEVGILVAAIFGKKKPEPEKTPEDETTGTDAPTPSTS